MGVRWIQWSLLIVALGATNSVFAQSTTYSYDSLNRLTRVVYGDGTTIDYRYDAAGNRISIATRGTTIPPNVTAGVTRPPRIQITSLTAQATGTAPLRFQWFAGPSGATTNPILGATTEAFTPPQLGGPATYWVQVTNEFGTVNSPAFTVTPFADDVLVANVTVVRAVHITELRQRIDAIRLRYGLAVFPWSGPVTARTTPIRTIDILDMRVALAQVYAAAKRTPLIYTDPALAPGTPIRLAHISEIRSALVEIE